MNTYEDLKKEIKSLEELRAFLETAEKFPEMGVKLEIILAYMQRAAKRIYDLVNPDEGGMLVSEKVEMPQKGDMCVFWNNGDYKNGRLHYFLHMEAYLYVDFSSGNWENCKVIKKGEGNV